MNTLRTFIILFSIPLASALLVSCKKDTREDLVRKSTEAFLKKRIPGLEGYEFVSLKLEDSTLYRTNFEYRKKGLSIQLENRLALLDERVTRPTIFDSSMVKQAEQGVDQTKFFLSKLDSIEKAPDNGLNKTASYNYLYAFNADSFEVKKSYQFYLRVAAPDFDIISMTLQKDTTQLNPYFPGLEKTYPKP